MKTKFTDGLKNIFSSLINSRTAEYNNTIQQKKLQYSEMREIYRTGIGRKIVSIKSGMALNDTIQFDSKEDEKFYNVNLAKAVKRASAFMISFGRGLVVINEYGSGADLSKPLSKNFKDSKYRLDVFSGDMVTVGNVSRDLLSPMYGKPEKYYVRGFPIHHSRCIDFTYIEPTEFELPSYFYGGISEFEFIYNQLLNDSVIERACPVIIEKSSNFIYKIKDFKENIRMKKDSAVRDVMGATEDMRSIFGAVVIDSEDDCVAVNQQLNNLADVDMISLRRLAMVTGLSITRLVGENAKGLNSTGDNEAQMDLDTIETIQSEYLTDKINRLMRMFGLGAISFKDNQGQTPNDRVVYESKVIDNALKLWQIGEDYEEYLNRHDITKKDDWDDYFSNLEKVQEITVEPEQAQNA